MRESPGRRWRDLQVVGQAATLAPEWYPIGGRAFLGLDPGRGCASGRDQARGGWLVEGNVEDRRAASQARG